jgi:predicted nucleic acid-binding protein
LVKRYVAEPQSELLRDAMQGADGWFMCRTGFVEAVRALGLVGGASATKPLRDEWPSFGVIEVDQSLVERAAALAVDRGLHSLDSIHLAAALVLPGDDLVFATWDRRLHVAAGSEGLQRLPKAI